MNPYGYGSPVRHFNNMENANGCQVLDSAFWVYSGNEIKYMLLFGFQILFI